MSKSNVVMNKIYRILLVVLIVSVLVSVCVTPAYAVANPDIINIPYAKVFNNVFQANDQLVLIYTVIKYTVNPATPVYYNFVVNMYGTNGTTLIKSVNPINYGYTVTGIYFTAAEVISNGLVWNSAYVLKINGSPLVFSTTTGNTTSLVLSTNDYILHTLNSQIYSTDTLAQSIIYITGQIATATATVLVSTSDPTKLNQTGAVIFTAAVPYINSAAPSVFPMVSTNIQVVSTPGTYAYQTGTVNVGAQLGSATQNAFKGVAKYFLGDEDKDQLVEAAWGMLLVMMVASFVFLGTGNPTVAIVSSIPMVIIAVWVGAFPMVILWLGVAAVILYMAYHLFLRGM